MIDYNSSYEEGRIGVYNGQAYYNIDGYYFVRETPTIGGDQTDILINVPILPDSLTATL